MRFSQALLAGALLTTLALGAPSDAQTVRELARETAKAMVAVEHRVTRAGSFQEGENPLDAQARSSGFIASPEGHVITHARFVKGRTRLRLFLSGGVKAWARSIGSDPLNRIAILRLEKPERVAKRFGGKLPHLSWGDSSTLRLGHTVFTIGNCFDSLRLDGEPTFSQGVITMIDRVRLGAYRGVVIETDASVNPGSFGGPLLNARGQVVGVLTRNVNNRRWLGSAVPGDQVRHNMERIVAGKPLSRGRLGVALKKTGGEASPKGLEVTRVLADSGAAEAGIKPGDRLLRVAGKRVYDTYDVARELTNLSPGTPLEVLLARGEKTLTLRVVLSEGGEILAAAQKPDPQPTQPRPQPKPTQPTPQPKAGDRVRLGVRLQAREAGPGLEVVEVDPNSPASEAGIEKGDIVVAMGRTQIRSMDDLANALARYRPGQTERVIVLRDRRARLLRLKFGGAQAQVPTPRPVPQRKPADNPGYLGVYLAPGGEGQGALVDGTVVGSPADKAGLESGDRIVAVDGKRVATDDDLAGLLRTRRAGETVVLGVERGSRRLALSVTLGVRGEEPSQPSQPKPQPTPQAQRPWLGVSLVDGEGGVEIRQVDPQSPLAKLGVESGDVITAIDGRRTPTVAAFSQVWQRCRVGQTLEFDLERKGWGKSLRVRLIAKP